jgi:glutamate racemase
MDNKVSGPIGIFDSGLGGLTVASAVRKLLPEETIIYFGDTAHLPYGDKSHEAILSYSKKITDFLLLHKCGIILAACNTVSATVWNDLDNYTGNRAKTVNVIDPVVKRVSESNSGMSIGVIGTKNTINSGAYPAKLKKLIPDAEVSSLATPLLVPMIEEGFVFDDISNSIIKAYLSNKTLRGIQTLILGCTHYPIISDQIRNYYDNRVDVVDSALIVAQYVRSIVDQQGHEAGQKSIVSKDRFFVSDLTEYFGKIAQTFFEKQIHLEKVDIWS